MRKILKRLALAFVILLAAGLAVGYTPDTDPAAMKAKYGGPASQFLTLKPGLTVHVRDQGLRNGPVLVLIHGSNASLHTWDAWVERLGGQYRIVSLDLPGHGLTGAHPERDYSAAAFVDTVDQVVNRLGVTRFALAGNSMGGWVSWNYAVRHPEKLTALILIDASGAPEGQGAAIPIGFRLAQSPLMRPLLKIITPRFIVARSLKQSVSNQAIVTEAATDRYWELLRYPGNREATGIRQAAYGRRAPATPAQMATLTMPTLILWGQEDKLIPVTSARWFARSIAGSRLIIYPGIGHLPMEETAERSAADASAFLKAVAAPAPVTSGAGQTVN